MLIIGYDYKFEAFMHLILILCISLMVVSNFMHFFFTFSSQNYHSFTSYLLLMRLILKENESNRCYCRSLLTFNILSLSKNYSIFKKR